MKKIILLTLIFTMLITISANSSITMTQDQFSNMIKQVTDQVRVNPQDFQMNPIYAVLLGGINLGFFCILIYVIIRAWKGKNIIPEKEESNKKDINDYANEVKIQAGYFMKESENNFRQLEIEMRSMNKEVFQTINMLKEVVENNTKMISETINAMNRIENTIDRNNEVMYELKGRINGFTGKQ